MSSVCVSSDVFVCRYTESHWKLESNSLCVQIYLSMKTGLDTHSDFVVMVVTDNGCWFATVTIVQDVADHLLASCTDSMVQQTAACSPLRTGCLTSGEEKVERALTWEGSLLYI